MGQNHRSVQIDPEAPAPTRDGEPDDGLTMVATDTEMHESFERARKNAALWLSVRGHMRQRVQEFYVQRGEIGNPQGPRSTK